MQIIKQKLDSIERVYATSFMGNPVPDKMLVASEGFGECKVYSLPDFTAETAVGNPGGTTDLRPHPENDDVFFAISKFIPVFQSEEAQLSYVEKTDSGQWAMNPISEIPFLHRFDVLMLDGRLVFLGATLCGSKKDKDDWSDPGKVIVGEIDADTYELKNIKTVLDGLYRNHGLTKTAFEGRESYLISGDFGTFVLPVPDSFDDEWKSTKLFDFPVSDIAVCDIDHDEEDEIALISPFHGNEFKILKKNSGKYETVYSREISFGHVLWGGSVNGIPSFLLGYRQNDEKLLLIRRSDVGFEETTVDAGCGPSQIACHQGVGCFNILSANRKTGPVFCDVALYSLFEDGELLNK